MLLDNGDTARSLSPLPCPAKVRTGLPLSMSMILMCFGWCPARQSSGLRVMGSLVHATLLIDVLTWKRSAYPSWEVQEMLAYIFVAEPLQYFKWPISISDHATDEDVIFSSRCEYLIVVDSGVGVELHIEESAVCYNSKINLHCLSLEVVAILTVFHPMQIYAAQQRREGVVTRHLWRVLGPLGGSHLLNGLPNGPAVRSCRRAAPGRTATMRQIPDKENAKTRPSVPMLVASRPRAL